MTGKNIHSYSAADIEKYHRGLLSASERHALEKAALEDPFLADALDGYGVAGVDYSKDIAGLKQRLSERIDGNKVPSIGGGRKTFSPFLRMAAMLLLVLGAAYLVYQFAFTKKQGPGEVAQVKQEPVKETVSAPATDSMAPTWNNASGSGTQMKPEQEKVHPATPATTVTNNKEQTSTATAENATAGETGKDNLADEMKTPPSGGAPVSTVPQPAPAIVTPSERSADVMRDKENIAREETKSKSLAKKQESAKNRAFQQPDDAKSRQESIAKQQTDDGYYRNQAMNTFRGRVTDASNVGLPCANVTNTRDNVGTYTDANGNFVLTSTDSVLNVQIRSLGYDNNNTQLRGDVSSNKVIMQEDRQQLSEVLISNQKPNATARSKEANRKLIEPEPVDGWVKYDSYLANNLNVPEDYKVQPRQENNYVQISFEIDKYGEPVNIRIEKSLCPSCDEEAKRLIKEGPKFRRNAKKNGRTSVIINF